MSANNSMKNIFSGKTAVIIALVIAAAGVGFGVSQYNEAQKLKTPAGVQQANDNEANALKAKVAILMQLPNEKPTIATVKDITKLKDQAFFKDAQNGDKVLIFTAARKAVIYRDSTNKIINSGPIAVTSDQKTATQSVSVLASLNGSSSDAASKLASVQGITVAEAKATKNYTDTQVFDASGTSSAKAQEIATALGGQVVSSVPNGETATPGAAIVVFVKR